jgi:small subunit ribosomal protein S17
MAEDAKQSEEKVEGEETPEERAEAAPVEEEAPAEEAPAEEAPAEEAPAEEAAEQVSADAGVAQPPDEEETKPTPRQLRKRARSAAQGPPVPSLGPDERAEQRRSRRAAAAAERRRHRLRSRQKRGEPGTGTPPVERPAGAPKVRQGLVVSSAGDKTITVRVDLTRRHPAYEKIVRSSRTLRAHDEGNQAHQGDLVKVVETRPLSRTKRWRLLEIVERAR